MSEEQSTFKVTDRRLFNPDGTPREVPPEERPALEAATVQAAAPEPAATPPGAVAAESPRAAEPQPESREETEPQVPGADDPASFVNFIMELASGAAASLGMLEHPVTHEREVNLPVAKHWIDVLGMLQHKTRGNLHPEEARILEGLLSDLRMQFVSLTHAAPKGQGRYSAQDILGGR